MRKALFGIIIFFNLTFIILILFLLKHISTFYGYYHKGNEMVKTTIAFQRQNNNDKKILIIGDSLGYGIGASNPEKSFAGRLSQKYPNYDIINKSVIGENIEGLNQTVNNLIDTKYEKIYVFIGGNDVIHYKVNLDNSVQQLQQLVSKLDNKNSQIYFMSFVDFRNVKAVPFYAKNYYKQRSDKIYKASINIIKNAKSVTFVDAYNTPPTKYQEMQAGDGFHLNDYGIEGLFNLASSIDNK